MNDAGNIDEVDRAPPRRERWLAGQNEAFRAAVNGAPLQESLAILVQTAIEEVDADRCAFYIANDEGTELTHVVGMPPDYGEVAEGTAIGADVLARGLAAGLAEPIISPDVREEPRRQEWLRLAERHGYRGCWSFPVIGTSSEIPMGTFALYFAEPRSPTTDDLQLARSLVATASIIIAQARSLDALRRSEERFRALVTAGTYSIYRMSPDWRLMYQLDSATLEITSAPIEDWIERYILEEDLQQVRAAVDEAIRTKSLFELEHRCRLADGSTGWVLSRAVPILDDADEITEWFGAGTDITAARRDQEALKESEEKYRSLFESMDEAYAVVEVLKDSDDRWCDFRFLQANPAFMHHTSMPYPVGKTATELLGTPNPRWTQLYGQVLDEGQGIRVEETEQTLGRTFDLNIVSFDQKLNQVGVIFTDITERKRAEQSLRESELHANVLLAELQHRVRNTLAVVRSIARRTAERSNSVEEMLAHFEGRLNAFSRVQSAITRTPGSGVELSAIIEDELLAVAAREGDQLKINGPEVLLQSRPAESLSLAIHELATNAVKYGALSVEQGRIRVSWNRTIGSKGEQLEFEWVETGLKEPPRPRRDGFGHEMLKRSLPYDLGAETDIALTEDGLRFTLKLPLSPDVLAKEPTT